MNFHDEVTRLAYELYEKSGRAEGSDREHWFEAEKIVKARHAGEASLTGKPMELSAEVVAKKVEETVKDTARGVESAAKKIKKTTKRP